MNIQTMKRNMKNEKGLTLIELLAVIVILGIIAAIAIPAVANIIQKSQVDAVKSDAIQAVNAAKLYVASNGTDKTTLSTDEANELKPFLDDLQTGSKFTVKLTVDDGHVTYTVSGKGKAGSKWVKIKESTIEDVQSLEWKEILVDDEPTN